MPPRSPASRASASSGNVSRSGSRNSSGLASRSSGGTGVAARSRVGERVGDRHAHVGVAEMRDRGAVAEADEPVDDRRSGGRRPRSGRTGRPKRKCASITSRPLFASVAESIVIFGAHRPGRVRERLLGGHVGELVARAAAERAAARGQDEALGLAERARTGRAPSARCRPGSARPPPRARAASASSPAATRLSLFASASVTPCSSAHIVGAGRRSRRRVQHDVGLGALEQLGRVAAGLRQRREPVDRRRAAASRRRARAPGARRSPRSPGGRSSRSRRAGRSASRRKCARRGRNSPLVAATVTGLSHGEVISLLTGRSGR